MILVLEENQIASIFVGELKRQLLTLKEIIDTDDGSFDEDIKINNKTYKALLKVLKYNLVEDDYDKWIYSNLVSKLKYNPKNSIKCELDGTFNINKKLIDNLNKARNSLEENEEITLNRPDKDICSFNKVFGRDPLG